MELTKLFHHGIAATFSKLMEPCLDAILFLIVRVPDKGRLSTMEHDVVTDLSKGCSSWMAKSTVSPLAVTYENNVCVSLATVV